jgi:quercetin dioxygenase-like cupin family protein
VFDDLEQFKLWWMAKRPINTPQLNALSHVAETHGVVLYRQKPYQVELFNVKPNSEIPQHIHPNVDSYEVYLSGDVSFFCIDKWHDQSVLGGSIRVKPNSYHGGKFGERGGCFFSIQKWLNDTEPKFVGDDWADKDSNLSYKESRENDGIR